MAEEKRLDNGQGQINSTEFGTIRVDDEVVASAAAIAVSSMEGIVDTFSATSDGFIGNMTDNVAGMFGKKSGTKGVRVDYKDGGYKIVINIRVLYGYPIPDLANEIQRRVKREVEQMTGAKVRSVDIFVLGLDFSPANEPGTGEQHA